MEQYLINCQHCGEAHLLTSQTLKVQCKKCGKLIFHQELAGLIDWETMQQHPVTSVSKNSKLIKAQ